MTSRLHENLFKGTLVGILFIVLLLQTLLGHAQAYKGFVASFGARATTLSSDITRLEGSPLAQTGGLVGLVYGNRVVKSKLGLLGYYSSGASAGTTDLFTSDVAVNFFPLSLLSERNFRLQPYITAGLAYDQYKFYGFYLNQEPGQLNYSQAEAPYLGKIKQVNANGGIGIQVQLRDDFDFIHLFSEYRYGRNLSTKTKDAAFAGTQTGNVSQYVVGISFGARR